MLNLHSLQTFCLVYMKKRSYSAVVTQINHSYLLAHLAYFVITDVITDVTTVKTHLYHFIHRITVIQKGLSPFVTDLKFSIISKQYSVCCSFQIWQYKCTYLVTSSAMYTLLSYDQVQRVPYFSTSKSKITLLKQLVIGLFGSFSDSRSVILQWPSLSIKLKSLCRTCQIIYCSICFVINILGVFGQKPCDITVQLFWESLSSLVNIKCLYLLLKNILPLLITRQ